MVWHWNARTASSARLTWNMVHGAAGTACRSEAPLGTGERLPRPSTLRYFFCPASGLDADADERHGALARGEWTSATGERRMATQSVRSEWHSMHSPVELHNAPSRNRHSPILRSPVADVLDVAGWSTTAPLPSALSRPIHRASGGRL
jgi:hypothetical protein